MTCHSIPLLLTECFDDPNNNWKEDYGNIYVESATMRAIVARVHEKAIAEHALELAEKERQDAQDDRPYSEEY